MDHISTFARLSVIRGSGFGLLAIICFMVGLAGMPSMSFKAGGVLCLLACFILILKAETADGRPYKRTEVWLMLEEKLRPPAEVAQKLISSTLKACYREFAFHYARAAAAMLVFSLILPSRG